ncbi:hypothetical protein Tco_1036785 [Tanacetum coccineum]
MLNNIYKEFVPQKQLSEPSVKQTCSSPYSIPFVKILETRTMPIYLDENWRIKMGFVIDQLLEASLSEDSRILISKDVSNESKTVDTACNDAFEVKQELSKRIVELEKDLSKSEAKGIAFEIALQHKSRENNSLKTVQKENENFMASLQLENAHLKQTYKDLFESVQRSKVEIKQCDEVKVKDDFDEIETKNIELEYRYGSSLIKRE